MQLNARSRDDKGVTLVIVALVLVVLMVFSAIVIDVGAVYNSRREDQNAADAGALAAAREIDGSEADLISAAMEYAEDTLDVDLTAAQWDSCASDAGALTTIVATADCISYDDTRVRVRIPDQYYKTTFGRVVGLNEIRHGAFAIAGLSPAGFGGVLPFGITGASASGGFGCLKSNSNGSASPWCGSTDGDFGFLDFTHYTDRGTGGESCGSGEFNLRVRNNIAMGVDHDLSLQGSEHPDLVSDVEGCTANPNIQEPDSAVSQTGNNSDDVRDGLFSGSTSFPDGQPARLRRSSPLLFGGSGASTLQVHGVSGLDNNPLWRFIPPDYGPGMATSANIPSSCRRNQFVDGSGNYTTANIEGGAKSFIEGLPNERERVVALLTRCITHYKGESWNGFPSSGTLNPAEPPSGCTGPCNDPVFALNSSKDDSPDLWDIQYTPRFGYVPEIPDFGAPNNQKRAFVRFRPIFIQRLVISTSGDDTVWDPGVAPVPSSTSNYQTVREVSVFTFPTGILPGGLDSDDAPFEIDKNRFVSLIR